MMYSLIDSKKLGRHIYTLSFFEADNLYKIMRMRKSKDSSVSNVIEEFYDLEEAEEFFKRM